MTQRVQPRNPRIDWRNPITKNLKVAFAPSLMSDDRNAVDNTELSSSRSKRPIFGEQSIVYSSGGTASETYDPIDTNIPANSGDHTFLTWWRCDNISVNLDDFLGSTSVSGNNGWRLRTHSQAGIAPSQVSYIAFTYGAVADYAQSTSSFPINGEFQQIGFSGTVSSDYDYVINGRLDSNISVGTIVGGGDLQLYGSPGIDSGAGTQGEFALTLYWERRLSEGEIASLYANPWQLFESNVVHLPLLKDTNAWVEEAVGDVINNVTKTDTLTVSDLALMLRLRDRVSADYAVLIDAVIATYVPDTVINNVTKTDAIEVIEKYMRAQGISGTIIERVLRKRFGVTDDEYPGSWS